MTLLQLLTALSSNSKLNISVLDSDGESLITFNAAGFESIAGNVTERTVESITVDSGTSVVVKLTAAS